jgi:hypothetical protein
MAIEFLFVPICVHMCSSVPTRRARARRGRSRRSYGVAQLSTLGGNFMPCAVFNPAL